MRKLICVDRREELALLQKLAAGQTDERILLIQAASGWGKSELLREFRSRMKQHPGLVLVDFKGGNLSLADVIYHICDILGWKHFKNLRAAVQHILHPAVSVGRNWMLGQNEIVVALGGPDEETRKMNRAALTRALVDDLRRIGGTVLVFDTFEQCAPELRAWFGGVFLPHVHRSPGMAVVIAGQKVPEETLMWRSIFLPLEKIAPEHWDDYVRELGIPISLEQIRFCYANSNGHPLTIATVLNAFLPPGGPR